METKISQDASIDVSYDGESNVGGTKSFVSFNNGFFMKGLRSMFDCRSYEVIAGFTINKEGITVRFVRNKAKST